MHDDSELVEERIRRELIERVLPLVHPRRQPLTVTAGPSATEQFAFEVGQPWGAPWGTTWFTFTGDVPVEWAGQRVEAILDLGFAQDSPGFQCEGLVRDAAGRPVQGVHPRRQAVPVDDHGRVHLVVEAASNPTFPQFVPSELGDPDTAGHEPLYTLDRAELVLVDPDAEALLIDLDIAERLMRALPPGQQRRVELRRATERSLDVLVRPDGRRDIAGARRALSPVLAVGNRDGVHRAIATGHAHIDTAWLWPLRETVRKCVRSFASAVGLMDQRPDYRFACSQAQQYAWIEASEPDLFERIRTHVAGGQWIPVGGMWVEPDMNLPSGESIVRQIVHGQRYFEEQFGVRSTEVWIPDVFGYPAGLPQVFAAGGMRRFVTQKLSWNRTNRFPHSTFWWEGVDGTRVLTHFPPVDSYGAEVEPGELVASLGRFREHDWSRWSLVPYGYGDGGGGPTREMLARSDRLSDLDGVPPVQLGSPADFFDRVDAELAHGAEAPVWRGELYFETHRGTLTSQLGTKLANKRCERAMRAVELWLAATGGDPGELDEDWRTVLTHQFHDIIPGSSIAWVHHEAEATLGALAERLEARAAELVRSIAPAGPALANVASVARDEIVVTTNSESDPLTVGAEGSVQALSDGRVAFRALAPALGLAPAVAQPVADRVVVTDRSMVNGHLAVTWDHTGALRSVIDVAHAREIVPGGASAAVLELSVDQPVRYDAWDLEHWARNERNTETLTTPESVEVLADGPLVGEVRVTHRFGPSRAVVTYRLRAGSARLDIAIDVDWHHDERLLSMAFPLDVRADDAVCGIQFGAVRRPMHRSTSWDAAKFEVCAHRWVDVAEPSFGVAVLNDGRWGHCVFDGAVRVSLARAAKYPDPGQDHGPHSVTLALFPHGGDRAEVVAEAERLDHPLIVHGGGAPGADRTTAPPEPIVSVSGRGVEVDAVKPADDGSGDLIVRLHETVGDRTAITIRTPAGIASAARCNLLEEPEGAYEVGDGIVAATLRPFQLLTLRLTRC
ncbi:MAG: alpha-mannosidase [Desertimonas sp.]